jgi:hypothetical protein
VIAARMSKMTNIGVSNLLRLRREECFLKMVRFVAGPVVDDRLEKVVQISTICSTLVVPSIAY